MQRNFNSASKVNIKYYHCFSKFNQRGYRGLSIISGCAERSNAQGIVGNVNIYGIKTAAPEKARV